MSLQLTNLVVGYNNQPVTAPITATMGAGQLTCLLGANGAGKSTLMRTLAGLQLPVRGNLPICNWQTSIAIVTTERIDVHGLLAREVVELGRTPHTNFWGHLTAEDHRIVDWAIKLTSTESLVSRPMTTLSDGERQKIMIAKALAQETPIVLLDEPTAFLDFPSKVSTMLLLQRLCHEMGKSILVSTHDLDLALQTADHLWLLSANGEPFVEGTPEQLANSGKLQSLFVTSNIVFDEQELRFCIRKNSWNLT